MLLYEDLRDQNQMQGQRIYQLELENAEFLKQCKHWQERFERLKAFFTGSGGSWYYFGPRGVEEAGELNTILGEGGK